MDEIARIVRPIAERYELRAVYLFGSYARGTATMDSDINLLIDTTGTKIKSLLQVAAVYCDLEEALGKSVDLVTVSSLNREHRCLARKVSVRQYGMRRWVSLLQPDRQRLEHIRDYCIEIG